MKLLWCGVLRVLWERYEVVMMRRIASIVGMI